ncbi:MAG: Rad2 nuclease [Thelocarpon impressellum]|nr:MAG: Rad2 nuclease [Thelocarpon impressellum]
MHRVHMLQHFGVTPFLVFDGDYLPSKAATEAGREKRREQSKQMGLELHRLGKTSQAYNELQKAVDVTPEMARQLIEELKKAGVPYVVAPYEADAQLTYLERKGIISAILSEDSDLLVFGAKCLLTKLDQHGGCVEINRADFAACRDISLVGWSDADFRRMAILSGCDYLASINKMGLKTAYRLMRKHKSIEAIIRALQFDGQLKVPPGYLQAFNEAELTFLYQRVFCPIEEAVVTHTSPSGDDKCDDMPFIGRHIETDVAIGVARGDLHPMTKKPLTFKTFIRTAPQTPWMASERQPLKAASTGSIDPKRNMPIKSFFRPRRIPLEELDPNSFTPSPSQQRVLRENATNSWSASPTPRPPVQSRSSTAVNPAMGPLAQNPWSRTASEPRTQKRARLCCEESKQGAAAEDGKLESGKSRFFTAPDAFPGVTATRVDKSGPKRAEFSLFSDDSIEDVMAGLPDCDEGLRSPTKAKVAVFQDEPCATGLGTSSNTGSACEEKPSRNSASPVSSATRTAGTSVPSERISDGASTSADRVSAHVKAELQALRARYAYQPPDEKQVPKARASAGVEAKRPAPGPAVPHNGARQIKPLVNPEKSPARASTPLQRLGIGALQRAHTADAGKVRAGLKRPRAHSDPANAEEKVGDRGRAEAMTLDTTRGSEDLMVPDSDEGEDGCELSPVGQGEGGRPSFNLGAFVFSPK